MRLNREISDELRALSEVVAGISQVTPYEAPRDGYFETLPELILKQIQKEATDPVLPLGLRRPASNPGLQEVPAGYFEGFAAQMLARVRSETESPKAQSAAEELAELSPLLSKIEKKTPFRVPEGYFNQSITIPEIPAVLAGLHNKPTYQVPVGYFEGFPASMLAKLKVKAATPAQSQPLTTVSSATTPVIQMAGQPRRQSIWWRIPTAAVAASVIIVITLLTLPTFNSPKNSYSSTNSDITKNLSNTTVVSDQDLQNFLEDQDNHNADQQVNTTALLDISENDVKSMLGEVSDAELKEYMDDQGPLKDLPTN